MSAPRWRNVRLAGLDWLLFDDALVRLDRVEAVRSVDPEAGPEGDDRGLVEMAGVRMLRVHFLRAEDPGDMDAEVALGFKVGGKPEIIEFANGGALASEVEAAVRDGDSVAVWFEPDAPPWTYRARPYPWAMT